MALYQGKAFSPQTAIAADIGATDTVIQISNIDALPDAPNYATIGTDEEGETIFYAAKTSDSLSGCQRGIEGVASSWAAGSVIARNFTAKDWNDGINAINNAGEIPIYLAKGVGNEPVQIYDITISGFDESNIVPGTKISILVDKNSRSSVSGGPRLRINGNISKTTNMSLLTFDNTSLYPYYDENNINIDGYVSKGGLYILEYTYIAYYDKYDWMIKNIRDQSKVDLSNGSAKNLNLQDINGSILSGIAIGISSIVGYSNPQDGIDGEPNVYTQLAINCGSIIYYDLSTNPITTWIGIKNNNTSARWTNGGITDISQVTPTPLS
jgi:hypothetical protein